MDARPALPEARSPLRPPHAHLPRPLRPRLVRFLREIDAEFAASSDHPEALFHELGYRTRAQISIPARAADFGADGAPPAFLLRLLPGFRTGYCVWGLERGN